MARGSHRDYDRDFADPLELPPEPIGFWGLSRRSSRWARDEDAWGTSARAREAHPRERARGGRPWGRNGYGWGAGRPYGAYEAAPEGYGRGDREERSDWTERGERGWREGHRGVGRGEVDPSTSERGTGAWGPGQAEPGLWGRESEPRRRQRPRYDRGLEPARARRGGSGARQSARGDIDWNGWGYEWTGRAGEPGRTASDEWGQYRRESGAGAWDYGRQHGSMLRASGEAARRSWGRGRGARPDLREGEAGEEVGPARWTHEVRPEDREGFAKEWDRGFYFGREDKGGGTPPSVGRHRWTRGTGPGPRGQENTEDYGPPARGSGRGSGRA